MTLRDHKPGAGVDRGGRVVFEVPGFGVLAGEITEESTVDLLLEHLVGALVDDRFEAEPVEPGDEGGLIGSDAPDFESCSSNYKSF